MKKDKGFKKLRLSDIKIESFVTQPKQNSLRGGATLGQEYSIPGCMPTETCTASEWPYAACGGIIDQGLRSLHKGRLILASMQNQGDGTPPSPYYLGRNQPPLGDHCASVLADHKKRLIQQQC